MRGADRNATAACVGKEPYRTYEQARHVADKPVRTAKGNVYRCPHCGFYHTASGRRDIALNMRRPAPRSTQRFVGQPIREENDDADD